MRPDLPIKDERYKNDASTLSHTSPSLGRQNWEKGGREGSVSRVTEFMDYTFKSPWRQEISTAKYRLLERRGATMEIISVHEKQFGLRQPCSRQHVGPAGASGSRPQTTTQLTALDFNPGDLANWYHPADNRKHCAPGSLRNDKTVDNYRRDLPQFILTPNFI